MNKEELLHDLKNIKTMLESFDFKRALIHLKIAIGNIEEQPATAAKGAKE